MQQGHFGYTEKPCFERVDMCCGNSAWQKEYDKRSFLEVYMVCFQEVLLHSHQMIERSSLE